MLLRTGCSRRTSEGKVELVSTIRLLQWRKISRIDAPAVIEGDNSSKEHFIVDRSYVKCIGILWYRCTINGSLRHCAASGSCAFVRWKRWPWKCHRSSHPLYTFNIHSRHGKYVHPLESISIMRWRVCLSLAYHYPYRKDWKQLRTALAPSTNDRTSVVTQEFNSRWNVKPLFEFLKDFQKHSGVKRMKIRGNRRANWIVTVMPRQLGMGVPLRDERTSRVQSHYRDIMLT